MYGSPGMGAAAASAGKLGVVGGGSPLGVGGWADLQRSGPGFYHLQPARQLQYPPAGTSYPAQQRLSPAGSPAGGGPLRPKVQHSPLAAGLASASQPGSPTLGRGRQWGSSGVLRSGSGMPGSPLIGAVRR